MQESYLHALYRYFWHGKKKSTLKARVASFLLGVKKVVGMG